MCWVAKHKHPTSYIEGDQMGTLRMPPLAHNYTLYEILWLSHLLFCQKAHNEHKITDFVLKRKRKEGLEKMSFDKHKAQSYLIS